MEHTTFSVPGRTGTRLEAEAITSLCHALQALSDPRRDQGKRYSLAVILCLVIVAKLAGEQTMSGVTEWVRHRSPLLAQYFGLRRAGMLCQTTYSTVLAKVDRQHLDTVLRAFFVRWEAQRRCGAEPSRLHTPESQADHRHLALDGKTIRATTSQPHPVHQLACYEVATGIVLWHRNVGQQENEISALKPLLTPDCVSGRLLTLDAMHTLCPGPSVGRTPSPDRQGEPPHLAGGYCRSLCGPDPGSTAVARGSDLGQSAWTASAAPDRV